MLARNISFKGGVFLVILAAYILFLEVPLVRMLNYLLPKVICKNRKIMFVIDLAILIFLARWTTILIWKVFT